MQAEIATYNPRELSALAFFLHVNACDEKEEEGEREKKKSFHITYFDEKSIFCCHCWRF